MKRRISRPTGEMKDAYTVRSIGLHTRLSLGFLELKSCHVEYICVS